uniref:Uncharacterized protein n=1 Tax=Romanomermis culicivorax TaxID=13658 RepID=A0A915K2E1_ROMCU
MTRGYDMTLQNKTYILGLENYKTTSDTHKALATAQDTGQWQYDMKGQSTAASVVDNNKEIRGQFTN